jgi:hypothetical protein
MTWAIRAAPCRICRSRLPRSLFPPLDLGPIDRQVHIMAFPATDMDRPMREASATRQGTDAPPPCSLKHRVRSRYHAFWYHLGEQLAWSRGIYRERPAQELHDLSGVQYERITSLQRRFRIRFEQHATQITALRQYDYLDLLDQGWSALRLPRLAGGTVQDIGSSNFWYAPVLHTFFQPTTLIGVEVEGHRMYINGYSRHDYAKGYIQDLPNTEFHIRDYRHYSSPANIITAWYPFVTPAPVLAWRLPLSLLAPHLLFSQVVANLQRQGLFLMVNQGRDEAAIAASWCRKVGLAHYGSCDLRSRLRPRLPLPVLSCWMCGPT